MRNTFKQGLLLGAGLIVGLLLLLAAVPSQTDFDAAYFRTNALPISLVGTLTNWAKIDTNQVSGGGTVGTIINTTAGNAGDLLVLSAAGTTNAVPTNTATAATFVAQKAFQSYQGTLTHAGTVTLDFNGANTVNSITLTGNVTFAFSNLATNRTYRLRVVNTQATNCLITFPAGALTNFFGGAPSALAAGHRAMWSMEAWGTTDDTVDNAWAAAQ